LFHKLATGTLQRKMLFTDRVFCNEINFNAKELQGKQYQSKINLVFIYTTCS